MINKAIQFMKLHTVSRQIGVQSDLDIEVSTVFTTTPNYQTQHKAKQERFPNNWFSVRFDHLVT